MSVSHGCEWQYNKDEDGGIFIDAAEALNEWASEIFEAVMDTGDEPAACVTTACCYCSRNMLDAMR